MLKISEKLKEAIQGNTELTKIQKSHAVGMISNLEMINQKESEVHTRVEDLNKDKIDKTILSTEDVIIYKVRPKNDDPEEWTNKYPYRYIYKVNDNWRGSNIVASSLDETMLNYLSSKHEGSNSQFTFYASRMLGMEVDD